MIPSAGDSLPSRLTLAQQADPYRLYELAVQCAEAEIGFVDETYRSIRGQNAALLREDFCGTANVSCEWVRRRRGNSAIGVDIDPQVLDWSLSNNVARLTPGQQKRIRLLRSDVLKASTEAPDIVSAMNFSYWLFRERRQLKHYFRAVRAALADDGIFFLDAYGGYDSFRSIQEEREIDADGWRFTYIWEQEKYEPISGGLICNIHFAFPDGSRLDQAFRYAWRLWTLPEIRELLAEVGFSRVVTYWQGWDEDGEPDGDFRPVDEGEADAGWICYLSAEK